MLFNNFKGIKQSNASHLINLNERDKTLSNLRNSMNVNINTVGIRKRGGFEHTTVKWMQYVLADCLGQLRQGNGKRWNFATGQINISEPDTAEQSQYFFSLVNETAPKPPKPPSLLKWRFKHIVESINQRLDYYDLTTSALPLNKTDSEITSEEITLSRNIIGTLINTAYHRTILGSSLTEDILFSKPFNFNMGYNENYAAWNIQDLLANGNDDWTQSTDQNLIFIEIETALKKLVTTVIKIDYTQGGNSRSRQFTQSTALSFLSWLKFRFVSTWTEAWNYWPEGKYCNNYLGDGACMQISNESNVTPDEYQRSWKYIDVRAPSLPLSFVCDAISPDNQYKKTLKGYVFLGLKNFDSHQENILQDVSGINLALDAWNNVFEISNFYDKDYFPSEPFFSNIDPHTWSVDFSSVPEEAVGDGSQTWWLMGWSIKNQLCEVTIEFPADANLGKD